MMESYIQGEDMIVFGMQVETFPPGIKETFGTLMKMLGANRSYYGMSWFADDGNIEYFAMASEIYEGEAKKYKYSQLIITAGKYHAITLFDWLSKTDSIKDIFHELTAGDRPDKDRPCIEWYKSDEEMVCMVKAH